MGSVVDQRRERMRLGKMLTIGAAGAAAMVVYGGTAAPTIYTLDSSELTTAAYTLGPAHPPGYPLYLLLGRLFITLFPWGDVGYRLNIMSAVFGALAVAVVCAVLLKVGCRRPAALAASLCLAFSFYFWSPALMAEVYTLHTFLTAVLLWLAVDWRLRQAQPAGGGGDSRLWLLAFVFGLGLGNHLTMLLAAPGLVLFVWLAAGRSRSRSLLRPRLLVGGVVALALGLSVYLYLPLRAGTTSWDGFVEVASARSFWPFVFAYPWAVFGREVLARLYDLWGNFLGFGLALILIGLWRGYRRDRPLVVSLLLIILLNTLFLAGYGVADKQLMMGHVYLLWAVFLGWGFQFLEEMVIPAPRWRPMAAALFMLLVLLMGSVNYSYADLSGDWRIRERAEQIMAAVEPDTAIFVRSWVERTPLEYLQQVEARRPDVLVLESRAFPQPALESFIGEHFEERPIYSTVALSLPDGYEQVWWEACGCYKVEKERNN